MSQKPPPPQFQLGGQALIEGVMMRSPHYVGAAVRCPDGHIETRLEAFQPLIVTKKYLNLPLVRGVFGLFEMLALGMKYLQWSGNVALAEGEKKEAGDSGLEAGNGEVVTTPASTHAVAGGAETPASSETHARPPASSPQSLPLWLFLLTVAGSLGLGFVIFVMMPNLIADWTLRHYTSNLVALNLFEGCVKLTFLVIYIWLIGLRKNIRRVFEYHGAEHKVVYAAENHLPLTPENARPFDTPHPRCGTGFALLTVFVSIACFLCLPWPDEHWLRIGWRFMLMPLVAGISYEIIKLTVNPQLGGLAKLVLIPGMWLQRLSTRQPDDSQLEVACVAMQIVIDAEQKRAQQTANSQNQQETPDLLNATAGL